MCLRPLQAQSSYFSSHSEETEHSLVSGIDDRASFSDDHGINLRCVERSRLEGCSIQVIPSFGPFQLGLVPRRILEALGILLQPPRLMVSLLQPLPLIVSLLQPSQLMVLLLRPSGLMVSFLRPPRVLISCLKPPRLSNL